MTEEQTSAHKRAQQAGGYGFEIKKTSFLGDTSKWITMGHETAEKARKAAFAMAVQDGWKPRRGWWQFWRGRDSLVSIPRTSQDSTHG